MIIALKLLAWVAYILLDAGANFLTIEINKDRPNYLIMAVIRGIAFVLYGVYLWDFQADWWYFNIFIFCTTSFWLLFDIFLNRLRRKSIFHIGKNSGWIDRFGTRYPAIYWACKVIALVALVWSVANIYQP